jgi:hypothetical protein
MYNNVYGHPVSANAPGIGQAFPVLPRNMTTPSFNTHGIAPATTCTSTMLVRVPAHAGSIIDGRYLTSFLTLTGGLWRDFGNDAWTMCSIHGGINDCSRRSASPRSVASGSPASTGRWCSDVNHLCMAGVGNDIRRLTCHLSPQP